MMPISSTTLSFIVMGWEKGRDIGTNKSNYDFYFFAFYSTQNTHRSDPMRSIRLTS